MRLARGRVIGVLFAAFLLGGCTAGGAASGDAGGTADAPVDAPEDRPPVAGTGGGAAGTVGAGGRGGDGGRGGVTGAAGAGAGPARDCLPACVASLRKDCQRPAADAGAGCVVEANRRCYSNGVKEITTTVNGGSLIVLTKSDGTTPCYQVLAEGVSMAPQHYQNAAGQEVGVGIGTADGGYQFTCNGTTVEVNFADPACATLNGLACIPGTCP